MSLLGDYPDSFGAHRASVIGHAGPASYTQLTAAPVAGGDTVEAKAAGLKYLDALLPCGLSDSGTYRVEAVVSAGHPTTNKAAAPSPTFKLRWVVVATGAEVAGAVNLSAEVVRLFALGRY